MEGGGRDVVVYLQRAGGGGEEACLGEGVAESGVAERTADHIAVGYARVAVDESKQGC